METVKHKILIVDDSPQDIKFLMQNLKDDYAVVVAKSGMQAIEMLETEIKPDIILMDVMMPEMNGYETCQKIKANNETKDIDVVFVSAHDTTEEKMSGYEAGGSDYIIKPISPEILLQKISVIISAQKVRKDLSKDKTMAMETAMTAMTSSGELGVILDFLQKSFSVDGVSNLAKLIIETIVNGYGLENTVQIRTQFDEYNYGSKGPVVELERELLYRLKDSDRIISKNNRLIINYDNISILIKNMPEDDDVRGRARDNIAALIEGAEARLNANEISTQQVENIITNTTMTLAKIKQTQVEQKEKSMQIMDNVLQQIEKILFSLGLTEEQETQILTIIQQGVNESLDNFATGKEADNQLNQILEDLKLLAK